MWLERKEGNKEKEALFFNGSGKLLLGQVES